MLKTIDGNMDKLRPPAKVTRPGYDHQKRDLLCFSHLSWDYVFQRPQHLLTRAAKTRRVFYFEEPQLTPGEPHVEIRQERAQLWVVMPHIPEDLDSATRTRVLAGLVAQVMGKQDIRDYVLWYYTPSALPFTRHLEPSVTVYDCMDELSLFKGANRGLTTLEEELFGCANLVFTGGQSLYEAKRERHPSVHLFPSSIDRAHFGQARTGLPVPADQIDLGHPCLGFFGVIDERMDLPLVDGVAQARPDWTIVLIGPIAKIDEADLPRRPNLHYLGPKSYEQLPAYLAGWDVALMPFAHNDATRFISPTKTPEYLAGGKPVVSTSIRDVVRPYGTKGLVRIADGVEGFVDAVEAALHEDGTMREDWLRRVDEDLQQNSWDSTWERMDALIAECARQHAPGRQQSGSGF